MPCLRPVPAGCKHAILPDLSQISLSGSMRSEYVESILAPVIIKSGLELPIATRASSLVISCSGAMVGNGILLSNKAFLRYARHQFLVGNVSE